MSGNKPDKKILTLAIDILLTINLPVAAREKDCEKLSFSGGLVTSDIPAMTSAYKNIYVD